MGLQKASIQNLILPIMLQWLLRFYRTKFIALTCHPRPSIILHFPQLQPYFLPLAVLKLQFSEHLCFVISLSFLQISHAESHLCAFVYDISLTRNFLETIQNWLIDVYALRLGSNCTCFNVPSLIFFLNFQSQAVCYF